MKPRSDYFHARRRRLRRQHRCTRCGCEPAASGKSICIGCAIVKAVKKSPLPSEAEKKAKDAKQQRLLHRLDLIEAARLAVLAELDRCA